MNLLAEYDRVNQINRCPVCGRGDWCLIAKDRKSVICARTAARRRIGDVGWMHDFTGKPVKLSVAPGIRRKRLTPHDMEKYLDALWGKEHQWMLDRQAELLGVSPQSLDLLQVRYVPEKACLLFPMFDERRKPIGGRLRRADGWKRSVKGGSEGVFISDGLNLTKKAAPVYIVEGPSDCAAMCHIGLTNVIGRPNCQGGTKIISKLLSGCKGDAVIVADPDRPGTEGAMRLANSLSIPCTVIAGDYDVRDFVSRSELTSECKQSILEIVEHGRSDTWKVAFRNSQAEMLEGISNVRSYATD